MKLVQAAQVAQSSYELFGSELTTEALELAVNAARVAEAMASAHLLRVETMLQTRKEGRG